MGLKIIYFGLIIPASKLPFRIVYFLSTIFAFSLKYIINYRKNIAIANLKRAFRDMSDSQIETLFKRNCQHLADILFEGTKNLTISQKQLKKRIVFKNTELFEKYYKEGKSLILMGSHCNNWEYIITAQNLYLPHQAVGIGQPLSNPFFNKEINKRRSRFGLEVVNAKNYKEIIDGYISNQKPVSILVLADQAPPNIDSAYWGKLFQSDTAFPYGGEILARKYNMPVLYLRNTKIKRGYYEIEPIVLSENPNKEPYGGILDKYILEMENQILENPSSWLWTHKRWKHEPPKNLEEIKLKNLEKFEQKQKNNHV